jgi:hypothetical protein
MLVALSAIAAADQIKAKEKMKAAVNQFLDVVAMNPNVIMQFHRSNMQLRIHSNASYLNEPKACSQIRGHLYLGNNMNETDVHNGAIHNNTTMSDMVISSSAESELGALFPNNKKEGTGFQTTLAKLGHSQNATPIQTNNTMAFGIANQKSNKDYHEQWTCNSIGSKTELNKDSLLHIYFGPSNDNLADYFTKHHTATHHQQMQPVYLYITTKELASSILRGCVETPVSIADVGLDSSDSGSHGCGSQHSLLSPMSTTRQQQLFLADSNQTASKHCPLFT